MELLRWSGKKKELPHQWKESTALSLNKKDDDKADCSKYRGTALLSTSYKIFIKHSSL
jgi:hypothetical protein